MAHQPGPKKVYIGFEGSGFNGGGGGVGWLKIVDKDLRRVRKV